MLKEDMDTLVPNNRAYVRWFWIGRALMGISFNSFGFMVYWLVERQTRHVQALLILGLLAMGAHVFSGIGGVWADRYRTAHLLKILPGIVIAVLMATVLTVGLTAHTSVVILMVAYAFIVILQNAAAPLFRTVPLQWVPKAQWDSLNAVAGIVGRLAVISSGLMDLILFHYPVATVWRLATPMGAALLAALIWLPVSRAAPVEPRQPTAPTNNRSKVNRAVFKELWQLSAFRNLTLLLAAGNIFVMPFLHLLPAWSAQVLRTGNQGYFRFQVCSAVGVLAGYGVAYWMSKKSVSTTRGVRIGLLMQLLILPFPWLRGSWLPLLGILMLGVSDGIQDAYIITLLQRFVPDHVQGRMFGALTLIVGGIAGPVGLGVLMLLSVWLSITMLFIIAAIGMCVVTLLLIRYAFVSLTDPVLELTS